MIWTQKLLDSKRSFSKCFGAIFKLKTLVQRVYAHTCNLFVFVN
jgi:hypothetical protein